jgi:hypothetical protein
LGLIDSVNKQNQLFVEIVEEEKNERLQNKNKKIRFNNYKMELQQYFYNEFKKQNNTEQTKKYFDTLENRLRTIGNIAKNKEDEFAERELNLLYNKELNFIYNIFKQDTEAQNKSIENQIFTGIQQTYKKHGIDAYYKLLDVQDEFLNKYNINISKYHAYYNKINKYFYNIYKTIYKNELEEEKQKTNILYYMLAILTGGLIRRNCWN